tara:strand:+ start:784 stop:1203 length:420 start_codon:yes stop_codon:yes gene_type:complete
MRLLIFALSIFVVQTVQAQLIPVVGDGAAAEVLIPVTFNVSASVPSSDGPEKRSEPLPGRAYVLFIDTFTRTPHPVQIAVTPAQDGQRQISVEMRFPNMQAFRSWFDLDETQHIIATLAGDGNVSEFEYALAMDANLKP